MRRIVAALLVGAAALVIAAAGGAQRRPMVKVTVTPSAGTPATHFVVSFRAPAGRGGLVPSYELHATGKGADCAESFAAPATNKRGRVTATLKGPWCPATYHGKVIETERPACKAGQACPQFIFLLGRIGRFSFTVSAPPGGSTDTSAPTFAGLQSAFACTPGPQRPGETTPFNLSWQAASDDQTPSSQIVYDIFMSTAHGGEDFSHPNWTSAPGVTTFRTPGLPSHGTFFFVVRARDQAGIEDQNKVERRGVDPCV
jgi:hypothetical protein